MKIKLNEVNWNATIIATSTREKCTFWLKHNSSATCTEWNAY